MVGSASVGSPQSVPKPSSGEANAALELIRAFGQDKSKLAKMLEDMVRVQTHNEAVLARIQSDHVALGHAKQAFEAEQESKEQRLADERSKLANDLEAFRKQRSKFDEEVVEWRRSAADKNLLMNDRERQVTLKEEDLSKRENKLAAALTDAENAQRIGAERLAAASAAEDVAREKIAKMSAIWSS